jgi:hypothetical protein
MTIPKPYPTGKPPKALTSASDALFFLVSRELKLVPPSAVVAFQLRIIFRNYAASKNNFLLLYLFFEKFRVR